MHTKNIHHSLLTARAPCSLVLVTFTVIAQFDASLGANFLEFSLLILNLLYSRTAQQWAAGEAILQEASLAGLIGDAGSGSSLFPLLRAAADLLMMPKELLMDKAIRLDVCCVLSMR